MKYTFAYLFLFFLFYCQVSFGNNRISVSETNLPSLPGDSVISRIKVEASLYGEAIKEYRANLYLKGHAYVKKKNMLLNYIPLMFKLKKGVYEYIIESYSELHYTAPNIFDNKIIARCGTIDLVKDLNKDIINLLNINIFSGSLHNNDLISPFAPKADKYYDYKIDSISQEADGGIYYLSFQPVNKSYQLIDGYVAVNERDWKIKEIRFEKRNEYLDYIIHITLGVSDAGYEEYLPKQIELQTHFHFLGNIVDGIFNASFDYTSIQIGEREKEAKKKYDLTSSFTLQNDTSALVIMTDDKFDSLRAVPLAKEEKELYEEYYLECQDSTDVKRKGIVNNVFWKNMGDVLFGSYVINSPQMGRVQFSPLLYPSLIGYSSTSGISYRQKIRYNRLFENDRMLLISADLGYNLKFNEFYFKVPVTWEYIPLKNGFLQLEIGNGNRIYASDIAERLGLATDTIDFDKLDIKYYRDYYARLNHNIEIINGLTVNAEVSMHHRSGIIDKNKESLPGTDEIKNSYTSFAPRISLSWTPGQYYYRSGRRKINVYSRFPTISIDFERSFKILGSSIKYEKVEVDLQHKISLGVMQTLFYRVGAGMFTEQEDRFFIDFRNFTSNNLPTGWNDDMGGVFQLLDRRWYNSSRKYIRGHLTYEVPFLLAPHLLKWSPSIINERVYISALIMPNLNPYMEFGYGIGTNFFDAGVFVNNINGKFHNVGAKFTLQLFNK